MNRKYNLKLDLQFRCNNSIMKFNQFDNNTSDFFIKISNGGKSFDVEKAIVVLAVIKPSGKVASQFIEVKNGLVYVDLKPNMKDEIGTYTAQAMLILEDERVVTDSISYEVEEDKIFSLLNDTVEDTEDFTLLTDMLNRLSTIEISEEQRVINEAERILSEENRKIEEAKRVEAELIRQHEEADRTKYDAIRESNENIRKQNESIRLANETNRIDEEAKRVEEEDKRKLAEEERNANYNFMTEDEERRRSEANAHKEAEALRVSAENTRVNEEAKRRTTEQGRISAENIRVSNENTRKANEVTRQTNETQRIEAETQRQSRYNSFIADAEANANNFENYTNNAKVKEEERKSNELNRKSQEDRRVSNEVERISNENTRKANEKAREKNETSRQNIFENKVSEVDEKIVELDTTKDNFISSINTKVDNKISEIDNAKDNFVASINTKVDTKISEIEVAKSDMTNTVSNKINEVETRFNALTSSQQQDAEVIDARDGETSLKARLDRDIEKAKQVYECVEGSNISTDSSVGYLKDIEILGNTIQNASNLADIRSVGDKVKGQELYEIPVLSCGKNLVSFVQYPFGINSDGNENISGNNNVTGFCKVRPNTTYVTSINGVLRGTNQFFYDIDKKFISKSINPTNTFTTPNNCYYVRNTFGNSLEENFQIEEGTVATPYEPYIEDKLTILSPVQLEKVGDVADRIIEKDGVWGVEKNVDNIVFNGSEQWQYNSATKEFYLTKSNYIYNSFNGCISDKFVYGETGGSYNNVIKLGNAIFVTLRKDDITNLDDFKVWLQNNNVLVMFITPQPQFIPLPHDQQVKLRTFAGKTNISFLTEIEGTIKAQVPKSLGATVNTHTEQISNLNKELDRVKKLEESTVSTVTTESDFTTVEQTSNGYFEDVKLEGKTLVNKFTFKDLTLSLANDELRVTLKEYIYSGVYTVVNTFGKDIMLEVYDKNSGNFSRNITIHSNSSTLVTILENERFDIIKGLTANGWDANSEADKEAMKKQLILGGDHTQNTPSYFEGLKSVGQLATTSEDGVDEIVVSSIGVCMFDDISNPHHTKTIYPLGSDGIYWDEFKQYLTHFNNVSNYENCNNLYDYYYTSDNSIWVNLGSFDKAKALINLNYKISEINNKADKKRLLYYNEETQTWEKPILREWDSIEKHADGKYYYHKRSEEVVLNGSESWIIDNNNTRFGLYNIDSITGNVNVNVEQISDKFSVYDRYGEKIGSFGVGTGFVRIQNNFGFTTANEFKQWLQANNVTVVYQLAQEKVYECTNIDLITYANETNYVVESGAIVPRTTLKVHNNISNVVSLLQKKVSLLESNVKASQEVQDMMILETDMRMLDIELALMEFVPMTLNLGGSNMLRSATYFNFLKNHIINETYEKEYLENVMNKYLATGRINQDEYNELYKMLYPPVYDIELPIEY